MKFPVFSQVTGNFGETGSLVTAPSSSESGANLSLAGIRLPTSRSRHCPLAFIDVLLAGAAVIIEDDETLHRPRQVGDDKADARINTIIRPIAPQNTVPSGECGLKVNGPESGLAAPDKSARR
jgi:hypothetical protein